MSKIKHYILIFSVLQAVGLSQNLLESGKDIFRSAETSDTLQVELYFEAAEKLEQYLLKDSTNPEAHYFLGYAYDRISLPTMNYLPVLDMSFLRKSVAHFLKSIELSPEYKGESWHLSAYSKIISIWGTAALSYMVKGQPDSAKICFRQILKNGVISGAYFDYGENLLRSIPQNAIVFSEDELETFLVYYLQLMDGLRKDVTFLHAGFLNAPEYVKLMKSNYFMGTYNAGMDISVDEIEKLQPQTRKPEKYNLEIPLSILDKYKVESKERFPKLSFVFPPVPEKEADSSQLVVTGSEQVIFDIIAKTKWLRDICFTPTYQGRARTVFSKYLRAEGLAYRMLPYVTSERNESINSDLLEVLLSTPEDYFDETANFGMPFDFGSINSEEVVRDRSLYSLIDNYSNLYFDLADSYLMMENKGQAKRVLIYFDMNLKPGTLIRNYSTVYRAALLYERVGELNDFKRLGVISEGLALKELEKDPFSYDDTGSPYDMLLDYYIKINDMNKLIEMLRNLSQRYPENLEIKEKLDALTKKG